MTKKSNLPNILIFVPIIISQIFVLIECLDCSIYLDCSTIYIVSFVVLLAIPIVLLIVSIKKHKNHLAISYGLFSFFILDVVLSGFGTIVDYLLACIPCFIAFILSCVLNKKQSKGLKIVTAIFAVLSLLSYIYVCLITYDTEGAFWSILLHVFLGTFIHIMIIIGVLTFSQNTIKTKQTNIDQPIQTQQPQANQIPAPVNDGVPEKIKEYKSLLDSGIISQEEFDAKKKELLG